MNEGKIPPIERLCEMAAHPDDAIAAAGQTALFRDLIEPLNDSFDPAACERYDRVMAEVIDYFRRLPEARELDLALSAFGIETVGDLLARKSRISKLRSKISDFKSQIRKILLLSRVTIGADVTVTSVLLSALRVRFPSAEPVLLGGPKLQELYDNVRIHETHYGRGARVLTRLMSWLDVVNAVEEEMQGFSPDEVLVIDPDSRLTQLGLLPVTANDRNYYFFESRNYRRQGVEPLSALTSQWSSETFGVGAGTLPSVSLPTKYRDMGRKTAAAFRRRGESRVITVSLGVGGNQSKRISEQFEQDLIERVVKNGALILDTGGTLEENEQAAQLVAALERMGRVVRRLKEKDPPGEGREDGVFADAVAWEGGVGSLAGLIAASDLYIGYDSAGQHIAAALGVPTCTIFVNSNPPIFAERWRPRGPGTVDVINLTTETAANSAEATLDLIEKTLAQTKKIQESRTR